MIAGAKLILGICGSISAYKAVELIRELKLRGALVDVIMTKASLDFITPLTVQTILGKKIYTDESHEPLTHIELPANADAFVLAPCTANTINKFSAGIADNLLLSSLLAFAPMQRVLIAPAMNTKMYEHPLTQASITKLKALGVRFVGPAVGSLACGKEGPGRLADTTDITYAIKACLSPNDLQGKKVLVTAGATREYIDPVRFITNRSSGKMGYALAREAMIRGAEVTLISTPTSLPVPLGIKVVNVQTALEMFEAVKKHIDNTDILVMASAVADYTPKHYSPDKTPKRDTLSLELIKTPDILKYVGSLPKKPLTVGFSAETGRHLDKAIAKLKNKNADIIVFNDVSAEGAGFDVPTNIVTIITRTQDDIVCKDYPQMPKEEVATVIFDAIKEKMELR